MDDFLRDIDRITSNTMIALSELFWIMREIRPGIACQWAWQNSSESPDLCTVDKLHHTYMNLLAAMDTVHFTGAKYFLALRAQADSESSTTSTHGAAVQEFRNACKGAAEHIDRVTERWDKVAVELTEYLPLNGLDRLEQLLLSGIYESCDHYPAERNKVLSILPSLHESAESSRRSQAPLSGAGEGHPAHRCGEAARRYTAYTPQRRARRSDLAGMGAGTVSG
ncbi:hypothetical protein FB45DRAFT_435553 [Roridomyces roridus]|uniref:Uncharacterized protein n=1 Tax=Roridomyces roridus TaxID=1738132 RepID=A0AAD7B0U2_9AGAR|nr:hypothetical protein FB45DRAFT_435553 [Roridomyces roridus]